MRNLINPFMRIGSLVLPLALAGCIGIRSFPVIEPLTYKPSRIAPLDAVPVDSLTPLFKWRQSDPRLFADFAIWSISPNGQPKDLVYSVKEIRGAEHRVQTPLKSNTEYFWSVRLSWTNEWATMKSTQLFMVPTPYFTVGGTTVLKGVPFRIRTPPN
jgi:hypothetical protein